jgi:hypothetical protein
MLWFGRILLFRKMFKLWFFPSKWEVITKASRKEAPFKRCIMGQVHRALQARLILASRSVQEPILIP